MNKTTSRILWLIAGILLVIAGIISLANPAATIITISTLLGVFMLIAGIFDIIIFASGNQMIHGSGWFLADGIITILLALFILLDQLFAVLSLSYIIGMWLMVSGTGKLVQSFELKRNGVVGWGWFTACGIIIMAAGFISFLSPVSQLLALSAVVGVLFILQGATLIVRACFAHRLWK